MTEVRFTGEHLSCTVDAEFAKREAEWLVSVDARVGALSGEFVGIKTDLTDLGEQVKAKREARKAKTDEALDLYNEAAERLGVTQGVRTLPPLLKAIRETLIASGMSDEAFRTALKRYRDKLDPSRVQVREARAEEARQVKAAKERAEVVEQVKASIDVPELVDAMPVDGKLTALEASVTACIAVSGQMSDEQAAQFESFCADGVKAAKAARKALKAAASPEPVAAAQ